MNVKKYQLSIIIIFISAFLFAFSCKNKKSTTNAEKTVLRMEPLKFDYTESYQTLWDTVIKQERNGLYKSALTTVEEIYKTANKDDNSPQIIKSLIYKMKYSSYLEENNFVKSLNELQTISKTANFPLKQLVHSITAESFWRYYQQNQWQINSRSYSSDFKNDDITTWDLKTIAEKTTKEYLLSLSSKDSLQHTDIEDFKSILTYIEDTKKFRPTLYDFLAYRSLSF